MEFVHEEDFTSAFYGAHRTILDGSQILVDFMRAQTVPGWVPRRLGGGVGGKKQSGQMRFGGRDCPFHAPYESNRFIKKPNSGDVSGGKPSDRRGTEREFGEQTGGKERTNQNGYYEDKRREKRNEDDRYHDDRTREHSESKHRHHYYHQHASSRSISREQRGYREHRERSEHKEHREHSEHKEHREHRERKEHSEHREHKEHRDEGRHRSHKESHGRERK